ncbi:Phosphatidylcholine-sterol acyltransferase [Choanephora cucurbitarum]|uniref:Phosphatidylcholine-sterol acyltransferase n=1 Tax=Choanephora cucurbitarum TaxID=101091 RepID=A0A1C7N742_9FUNG|nr:Phosphatidylcholine-sterol acyltransferase [Choanephora cucurbitarum]
MKLLSLAPLSFVAFTAVSAIDRIIAYGDSFTDNGNVYRHSSFPPSPPNYKGRFSNGPTWLEYVANNLPYHKVLNNAYSGATTDSSDVYVKFNDYTVPGLLQQINTIPVNGTSNDLYLIFIGYNDLASILNLGPYNVLNQNYNQEKVVQNMITGVKSLITKYNAKQFLILNVPPFDQWPVSPNSEKSDIKQFILEYNTLVEKELKSKVTNVDLKFLDDNSWFVQQLAEPKGLGLSTTNGPCSYGLGNTTICADPSRHFFWDSFHPEAKVHKAFGQWATSQIQKLYNL